MTEKEEAREEMIEFIVGVDSRNLRKKDLANWSNEELRDCANKLLGLSAEFTCAHAVASWP
jgi:hypothetical protein